MAWRRSSLLAFLRLTAVIGTAWLAAVFATSPGLAQTPFGFVEILVVLAIWAASIVPLSNVTRFLVVEFAYFAAAADAMSVYGTAPGVPVILGMAILLATIYYDRAGGYAAGLVSLALVGIGAWGWTTGKLPLGPALPRLLPTEYDFWMRTMFAQVLAVCGITAVVTIVVREKRTILARLRHAEDKFAKAFVISPDAMIITELETGRFIEVNDSHERLTGYSRSEVLGRTSLDIGTFQNERERDAYAGPLKASGSLRNVEQTIRHRSGRAIHVVYSAECFDLAGVTCAVTIIRDITNQKRTESALAANEERFQDLHRERERGNLPVHP